MGRIGIAFCALFLLAAMPLPAGAQADPPSVVGWELGVLDLESGEATPLNEGSTTLRYWVRNDNIAGDVALDIEFDNSMGGSLDGEESISVGSGRNETFSVQFSDVDVWNIAAGSIGTWEVRGTLTSVGGIPAVLPSTQSDEGEVVVPALHRWMVTLDEIEHPVSAGTNFHVGITILNNGNTVDSIRSLDLNDDCPVLTADLAGVEDVVGTPTDMGVSYGRAVVYDASSTHPSRICEIELTVRSAGVAEGGEGDASNKDAIQVQVEARPVGAQQDHDDANVGDDDGPQNQREVTSDNFLLWPGAFAHLGLLAAALARAREM